MGVFPSCPKYLVVKPLFKKGDKNSMSTYRRTSFSNVFENVKYAGIYQHLIDDYILVSVQFGFRVNSCTNKANYKLLNEICSALNNKWMVGGKFCNFVKACGCVNHNILQIQIEFCGIIGMTHKLIISYLEDKFQRV